MKPQSRAEMFALAVAMAGLIFVVGGLLMSPAETALDWLAYLARDGSAALTESAWQRAALKGALLMSLALMASVLAAENRADRTLGKLRTA